MTDADVIRAVGATRVTQQPAPAVFQQLDRLEAMGAHNTAQLQRHDVLLQRILAAIERIAGKPPPDGPERNATRG